ncbi:MAG TPA: trypsin-like peptidase domain-containing protein [Patescibacteria group bacterium]|nr:trypsin-like peptidase domain-containing protein [Patescibacteria group bacterium]
MRKLLIALAAIVLFLGVLSAVSKLSPLSDFLQNNSLPFSQISQPVRVVSEESITIDIVKKTGPSVVTVVAQLPVNTNQQMGMGQFFMFQTPDQTQVPDQTQPQDIGSGFIVSPEGMIVTNKHVVSDTTATYQIVTANNKKYDVKKIYRDPVNDIAIIKIDPSQNKENTLKPVTLGDSSNLQVGQFAVAIGTALGEFRNTVTTGVVSGLGRGITAGDQLEGFTEQLNNVIQTSAAINPGNSGGPLVNSSNQVIGMNTAVAQNGQNIGFAMPINIVKDSLNNFNKNGQQFLRPYLGIGYKSISQAVAVMNDLPQGAYVEQVVAGSPAEKAGIKAGDVITQIDGKKINDQQNSLATIISSKKVGDSVAVTIWRDNATQTLKATLVNAPAQ